MDQRGTVTLIKWMGFINKIICMWPIWPTPWAFLAFPDFGLTGNPDFPLAGKLNLILQLIITPNAPFRDFELLRSNFLIFDIFSKFDIW